MIGKIHLRLYEELNEFLSPDRRKRRFDYSIEKPTTVEELLAALGVPDSHVELALVNNNSVDLSYPLKNCDVVSLYPVIESLDVSSITRIRKTPLRRTRFMAEAGFSHLVFYLRLFGFDTLERTTETLGEMIRRSENERRILLTRNAALSHNPEITRIHLVEYAKPRLQLIGVLSRFDLYGSILPFSRCLACNGILIGDKETSRHGSRRDQNCPECKRRYRCGRRHSRLRLFIHIIRTLGAESNDE